MRRRVLVCSAAAGLCLSAALVWAGDPMPGGGVEFSLGGVRRELKCLPDELLVDDGPQRRLDAALADLARQRLEKAERAFASQQERFARSAGLPEAEREADRKALSDLGQALFAARDAYTRSTSPRPPARHGVGYATLAAAGAAPLLAWWAWRFLIGRRRESRTEAGLCPRCCYDLTGHAAGRCPGCGAAVVGRGEA